MAGAVAVVVAVALADKYSRYKWYGNEQKLLQQKQQTAKKEKLQKLENLW